MRSPPIPLRLGFTSDWAFNFLEIAGHLIGRFADVAAPNRFCKRAFLAALFLRSAIHISSHFPLQYTSTELNRLRCVISKKQQTVCAACSPLLELQRCTCKAE